DGDYKPCLCAPAGTRIGREAYKDFIPGIIRPLDFAQELTVLEQEFLKVVEKAKQHQAIHYIPPLLSPDHLFRIGSPLELHYQVLGCGSVVKDKYSGQLWKLDLPADLYIQLKRIRSDSIKRP